MAKRESKNSKRGKKGKIGKESKKSNKEKQGKNEENLSQLAVTSSGYKIISSLIGKVGGLIFTVVLARLLMPELFGAYQLVFSIIRFF